MTIGDAGTSNDDASYAGETGDSTFSMQYLRNKAREFQSVMNGLDAALRVARSTIDEDLNPQLTADMQSYVADIEGKLWQFRTTAETINAGAAAINAAGGRFPALSVPQTLGIPPIIVPAAAIAALGVAAGLITWGVYVIKGINERLLRESTLGAIADPAKKAALAALLVQADQAASLANTPLSDISSIVKWLAIGAIGFLAYRTFEKHKGNPLFGDDDDGDIDSDDGENDE